MADDIAYWLREMSEQRTAVHLDTLGDAANEIERLRAAGDELVKQMRFLIATMMTEQEVMHGHVAINADALRAVTEWDKARTGPEAA